MDIGVFAFIQDTEGKILLVRDAGREQKWTMPGGGLEFQELIPAAIEREVKEEAGVDIIVGKLIGIFSQKKTPGIAILFDAKISQGTLIPDGIETSAAEFFSYEQILSMGESMKPAQLGMIKQRSEWNGAEPIFNYFS